MVWSEVEIRKRLDVERERLSAYVTRDAVDRCNERINMILEILDD